MPKEDVIYRNSLRLLGGDSTTMLPPGGFGAIVSRAGTGKTALLVQIALERMLRKKDVVHLSLADPLDKVKLWYKEAVTGLCATHDRHQAQSVLDEAAPHRLIMTFLGDEFSVPRFEQRLTELTEQNIISPEILLVDGLDFDRGAPKPVLSGLKEMAQKYNLRVWFAIRSHRHEQPGANGIPFPLAEVSDMFDTILELQATPVAQATQTEFCIFVRKSIGDTGNENRLVLDPATMLVKNH